MTSKLAAAFLLVLLGGWTAFAFFRSPPAPRLVLAVPYLRAIPGTTLVLTPPARTEEEVALEGIGPIAITGEQSPAPIASLTKIMSALVVLRDHPLAKGANGPSIPITPADVVTYRLERSEGDSVVAVRAGERLSELQALEAALIPSGDNITQLLAGWDAGSSGAFTAKMNALARTLGLRRTSYADPSGVDPATVSTAADQVRLAEVAMAIPVFAGIVRMDRVSLPVAGIQYNVDDDLGSDGIDGVKTGWIPESGGCFVFSATDVVEGRRVSILGAVLGEKGATPIPSALASARKLVTSAEQTIRFVHLRAGTTVATIDAPSGAPVRVVTSSSISLLGWSGARAQLAVQLPRPLHSALKAGSRIGAIVMSLGSERTTTALNTASALTGASFSWRLTHP